MKVENLRSLIRESINEYIREIDNKGNEAALQAKITATQEAIALREKKMSMEGLDEAYHDMLDKGKMKELSGEVKALNKSLKKLENQLNKLKSKSEPKAEVVADAMTKENPIGEIDITSETELEEARFKKGTDIGKKGKGFAKVAKAAEKEYGSEEAGKRVAGAVLKKVLNKEGEENTINESFLKMQKLAGVITESQYNEKKSLIENQLNEFDMDQFAFGRNSMSNDAPKASFEDKWNTVPNANKEVLKKSTGKEPIVIMASSKGSNHLVAKGPDSKFYLYTFTQAANPGEPKGPFNSEEDAKKQVK